MKKVNKNLVDRYCLLRSEMLDLSGREKELREKVLHEFDMIGINVLPGHNGYSVRRVVSNSYTVKPAAFFKRVLPAEFLNCVTVSIKKAQDYLSRDALEKISSEVEKVSLKVQL